MQRLGVMVMYVLVKYFSSLLSVFIQSYESFFL